MGSLAVTALGCNGVPLFSAQFGSAGGIVPGEWAAAPGAGGVDGPGIPAGLADPCGPSDGATVDVGQGGDLQAALDAAAPGDTIRLAAGATFTGNFVLPMKTGNGCITVRTSTPDTALPAGRRVTGADAERLARLVTPNSSPALRTATGAHHWRLLGLEVTQSVSLVYTLVAFGGGFENALADLAHHLVLERSFVHGNPGDSTQRGVGLNSAASWVVDSTISECKGRGYDTQAIGGWNGPGPFLIHNNFLEGAGENVMFGGADPRIQDLVPSDIVVTANHFYKPPAWRDEGWSVKNIFELKNARRVTLDGNLFENNWANAQAGLAIVFTVRNQDGNAPWSVVEDVTFTNNVLRHSGSGFNITGTDNLHPSQRTRNILIRNNLFEDISSASWGGSGTFAQILAGPQNVVIDHNTVFQSGNILATEVQNATGFRFTNNIVSNQAYGVHVPTGVIADAFPDGVLSGNVFAGTPRGLDRTVGNHRIPSHGDVGYVNLAEGDFRLAPTSVFAGAAEDGTDFGVDWSGTLAP